MNELEDWVAEVAGAPTDRPLDRLEAEIGCDIARRRREARALKALSPVRLGAIGLALAIGATAGAGVALDSLDTPQSAGVFAAGAQLAPSTLLDGAG